MLFMWLIIGVLLLVMIAGSSILFYNYKCQCELNRNKISFKESMDLTELPVVTFKNNNQKINFLLDTGSNISYINQSIVPNLKHKILKKSGSTIGIEGKIKETLCCQLEFNYKDIVFIDEFSILDLDASFNIIKEESGVQIHGILGSKFFEKYKYVLDFSSLTAYIKK